MALCGIADDDHQYYPWSTLPFPFKDDDQKLCFKAEELINWFPEKVVEHRVNKSNSCTKRNGDSFYLLPDPQNLPVVFAARLSLSFSFLLCAVPLYAINYDNRQKMERCWFSDGGICSNFPIHFSRYERKRAWRTEAYTGYPHCSKRIKLHNCN